MPHTLRTLPLAAAASATLALVGATFATSEADGRGAKRHGAAPSKQAAPLQALGNKSRGRPRRPPAAGTRAQPVAMGGRGSRTPAPPAGTNATPTSTTPVPGPVAPPPVSVTPPTPQPPFAIGLLDVVTPVPAGIRAFAPTSVWNQPLTAGAALDPASDRLVGALRGELAREMPVRSGPWIATHSYSVPVYTVGADVPAVHVTLDTLKPELQRAFDAVPIPAGARAAAGTDQHLVIYRPATDTMWEFWHARLLADGWHAGWGGRMEHVSSDPGYYPNTYGASGTSLPLLGGLMTTAELKAGKIDHALAMALPLTAAGTFTWPAQRSDGRTTGPNAIPEGTRFRIDPALDLSKLPLTPVGRAMARAAQRYGIIVRDGAACVVFYAEDPTPQASNPYPALFGGRYPDEVLAGFPWDRLQAVAPPSS